MQRCDGGGEGVARDKLFKNIYLNFNPEKSINSKVKVKVKVRVS